MGVKNGYLYAILDYFKNKFGSLNECSKFVILLIQK